MEKRLCDRAEESAAAAGADRADLPERYRWNLADIYETIEAWKTHRADIVSRIDEVLSYKGRLAESAETLTAALTCYFEISKDFYTVYTYAMQLYDEDLRVAEHQELTQDVQHLSVVFGEKTAFVVPELTKVEAATLSRYRDETPQLEDFRRFLEDIQRKQAHTLSEPEEKLLAGISDVARGPEQVYSIFNNAEFPYAEVTLSTGEAVTLTAANYAKHRTAPEREDRALVMKSFFEKYGTFKNTLGANLVANLKSDHFYAKSRKYASCLEAALDSDNIPVSVYETLITQIHQNLPTLHRFLDLKRRMLRLDTLHYYDVYASLVKEVDLQYTIEQGQELICQALHPLGQSYLATVREAFDRRWIDYMPTSGKRSGAYSNGAAYDVHPYILMNWNGNYESLRTLMHELGHSMHSYLSNSAQPFPKAEYSIFVAEIASTFNENLLNHYMLEQAASDDEKLFLLGHYLEGLRGTIFRQVQFAEFEWEIHKKIEQGTPLSGESLSALYLDLTKTYYGHEQGVCCIDPEVACEWSFIPHFYYNFYVFQYATSLIYSTALAEKVLRGDQQTVEKYLRLLQSGGAQYPIDLVRATGIDPLASEAFELTMQRMNSLIDQIEAIVGA